MFGIKRLMEQMRTENNRLLARIVELEERTTLPPVQVPGAWWNVTYRKPLSAEDVIQRFEDMEAALGLTRKKVEASPERWVYEKGKK